MEVAASIKPVVWVGTSKEDLSAFPEDVRDVVGYALFIAQQGGKHVDAKPLHGFGGSGVLEVVANQSHDTFRAVYTVRLAGRIYVLHAFQKKSKSGVKTPKAEIDLIRARLRLAQEWHARWLQQ